MLLQVLAQAFRPPLHQRRLAMDTDYCARRSETLQQERTARKSNKNKQPCLLRTTSAYERKQIHAALSKYKSISNSLRR